MLNRILNKVPVGTRSILFGAHLWWWHPILLAIAWTKLYGFPKEWQLWVVFFCHDLGYWSKTDMDEPEGGELHPYLGARIINVLVRFFGGSFEEAEKWWKFSLYHSRYLARRHNENYSKLCVADKYALALEPKWWYLFRVSACGEIVFYINYTRKDTRYKADTNPINKSKWFDTMVHWTKDWALSHIDLQPDEETVLSN